MREIKFRAKKKCNEEWVYGGYYEHGGYYYIVNVVGEHWEVDEETIAQYTGWDGINGEEIYENSILENFGELWIVEWMEHIFSYVADSVSGPGMHLLFLDGRGWDVVGNIHDDPELMEVE